MTARGTKREREKKACANWCFGVRSFAFFPHYKLVHKMRIPYRLASLGASRHSKSIRTKSCFIKKMITVLGATCNAQMNSKLKVSEDDYASGLSYTPETRQRREKKFNSAIQNQVQWI